jgi:hypothetical protein
MIEKSSDYFHYLSNESRNNEIIALKAIKSSAKNINLLGDKLKFDIDFMTKVIGININNINFLD